jgi:hypothetical protein
MLSTLRKRPAACSGSDVLEDFYRGCRRSKRVARALPGGSAPSHAPARSAPPGPDTVEKLSDWPTYVIERLTDTSCPGGHGRRHRLFSNFYKGLLVHSDYTGLGTAEIAASALGAACRRLDRCPPSSRVALHRGCDTKPSSQYLMLNSGRHGPDHVHDDVLGSLRSEVLGRLTAMEPEAGWSLTRKQSAYKAMHAVMQQEFQAKTLFRENAASWCLKHVQDCPAFARTCPGCDDPLTLLVSGTSCIAWTSAGKQEGSGHESQLPWLAFVHYILHFRPDVVIHEITELHPDSIFAHHFGDEYDILNLLVSPWHVGWPCNRSRKYRVLTLRSRVLMRGTELEFFKLLESDVAISPAELFCADEESVTNHYTDLCVKRRRIPKATGATRDWEVLLSPPERARLAGHRERVRGRELDGCFFADLNKADGVTRPTKYVSVLLQNSHVWSEALKRPALPAEHFVFQGFPVFGPMNMGASLPWADALGDLPNVSDSEIRSLTGNAMHMAVVGAVIGFAVASSQRIRKVDLAFHRMESSLLARSGDETADTSDVESHDTE